MLRHACASSGGTRGRRRNCCFVCNAARAGEQVGRQAMSGAVEALDIYAIWGGALAREVARDRADGHDQHVIIMQSVLFMFEIRTRSSSHASSVHLRKVVQGILGLACNDAGRAIIKARTKARIKARTKARLARVRQAACLRALRSNSRNTQQVASETKQNLIVCTHSRANPGTTENL
jgi:hypothetical protein